MIGKAEWFTRRKYTGWGFTPKTWQGWAYIVVIFIPVVLIARFPMEGWWQTIFLFGWGLVFAADFIDIMWHLDVDERERIHEAISERNALWAIVTVLGVGIAYQAAASVAVKGFVVDPVIYVALAAGILVKIATNIYLDRTN